MSEHFEKSHQVLTDDDQRNRVTQAFDAIQIVQLDGSDIGMMKVVREQDTWHLVQIQLTPGQQRQGLGAHLINELLEEANEAGMPISLHVLKVNPARNLYERLGFEVVADTGHSYEMRVGPQR